MIALSVWCSVPAQLKARLLTMLKWGFGSWCSRSEFPTFIASCPTLAVLRASLNCMNPENFRTALVDVTTYYLFTCFPPVASQYWNLRCLVSGSPDSGFRYFGKYVFFFCVD